ncbi:MAG: NepR family anti-sigma factor [Hyphomicrobiaceae bacterium]
MTMNDERNARFLESRNDDRSVDRGHDDQPWIDSDAEALLGRKLASVYSELVEQPVPDRFKDLLDRLMKERSRE